MKRLKSGTSSAAQASDFSGVAGVKAETIIAFFSQTLPGLVKDNTKTAEYHLLRIAHATNTVPADFFDLSGKTGAGELLLIKKNWELDVDAPSGNVAMITGDALFCFAMKTGTSPVCHFMNNRMGTEEDIDRIIAQLTPETSPLRNLWRAYSKASTQALGVPQETQPDIGIAALKRIQNVLTKKLGGEPPAPKPL